jgi:hypothetical protein
MSWRVCLGVIALAGCMSPEPYHCAAAADCTLGGEPGFCEADGRCSVADGECPSGRRFVGSGCVPGDPPLAAGRLCLPGVALPASDPCAAMVCGTRPWCCATGWDESCVHAAETVCEASCSGMLAGAAYTFAGAGTFDGASYEPRWSDTAQGWVTEVAWGDFDGDGHPDLAVAREQQNPGVPGVVIYPFNFDGGPLLGNPRPLGGDDVGSIHVLQWVEHGNDGTLDLLAGGRGGVYILLQDASGGSFTAHQISISPVNSVAWVDPDGAAPWLLAIGYTGDTEPEPDVPDHVLLQQLDETTHTLDQGSPLGDLYTGDFALCAVTGSAARDLIIGSYPAYVAVGNGSGFDAPTQLGAAGYHVECGDMDRDGDDDLVLSSGSGDPVDVLLNDFGLNVAYSISSFTSSDAMDIGDVDGDHDLDVITSSAALTSSPIVFLRTHPHPGALKTEPPFVQSTAEDGSGPDWTRLGVDLGPLPPPPP